jgi:ribosomal protein S18 acetylase RimI-like enzyme
MILKLEEISLNAWPALETIQLDGWVIRYANGVTKRSNSVNPIYESTLDLAKKIDFCEKFYRSKAIPVCFKITDIAQPSGLDDILEDRGYAHKFDVLIQTMDIGKLTGNIDKNIHLLEETDDRWLDHYIQMNGSKPTDKPVYKQIIDTILLPKCLFLLTINEVVIGCGLGVVEEKFIGLFDIVIDPQYRNQGFGKLLVGNILKWGKSKGAERAYLQVLADNAPAIRLYEKVGFKEEYSYWYRIKA